MRIARKLCKACGVFKERDTEFWRQPKTKDGLRYVCKDCDRLARKMNLRQKKVLAKRGRNVR